MTDPRKTNAKVSEPASTRRARPPLSRRALVVGAVPVAAATIGVVGALAIQYSRKAEAPGRESTEAAPTVAGAATAARSRVTPVLAPATPTEPSVAATPVAQHEPVRELRNIGVPGGMALVASPRLPLTGVGPEDPWRLLTGRVADWSEVGSAVALPVNRVGLASEMANAMRAERTFESYEELATALSDDPGAVALVPTEMVDFRVQALTVGEDDPLRMTLGGRGPVRIGVVGDIVPGRNVHLHMVEYGDFTRPFLRVAPLLRSFDVTVANLEGNLSDTLPQPADPHSVSFVSSPVMLEGFQLAGIDAVTLANNHSVWNDEGWGVQGLLDTIAALDGHSIPYFGAGPDLPSARAPWVVTAGGTRIAFLGIDGVTANYEVEPGAANGVLDVDVGATSEGAGTNPYLLAQLVEDVAAATTIGRRRHSIFPSGGGIRRRGAAVGGASGPRGNRRRRRHGVDQPPAPDPGHGDLRRQADNLLPGELHSRSNVGGGGAIRLCPGDHSPGHLNRWAAISRRRDRGFSSTAADVVRRAGGAHGPLLGGKRSTRRARRASCLNREPASGHRRAVPEPRVELPARRQRVRDFAQAAAVLGVSGLHRLPVRP